MVMTEDVASLNAEVARQEKVIRVLMDRAERSTNLQGSDFSLFQTAIMLEEQVRGRTAELEAALHENARINRDLKREREEQQLLINRLADAHSQLLQSEKLASVGQLAAGVAHEINNPISFVLSNLHTLKNYVGDLLFLLDGFVAIEPELPESMRKRLVEARQTIELDFLRRDVVAVVDESVDGAVRVQRIVQSLRDFARPEEVAWQATDLHKCLESALDVAASDLNQKAEIVRQYGNLAPVMCIPSQINQVFLNVLLNAAQAISGRGVITIRTVQEGDLIRVAISDTGAGMPPEVANRVFDPFFTTRGVGKGTGLGLTMAYGIVERHGGRIELESEFGHGSTFTVILPLNPVPR